MRRDGKAFLWDVANAAASIRDFTAGKSLTDYLQSELLRSAVERKFGIIGEALSQLLQHFPHLPNQNHAGRGCDCLSQPDRALLCNHPG